MLLDKVKVLERQPNQKGCKMMKKNEKRCLLLGSVFLAMFVLWTALIQMVDVQSVGQNETSIGFATFNCWFHHLIGVNKVIYTITDWMGLVPIVSMFGFRGCWVDSVD